MVGTALLTRKDQLAYLGNLLDWNLAWGMHLRQTQRLLRPIEGWWDRFGGDR